MDKNFFFFYHQDSYSRNDQKIYILQRVHSSCLLGKGTAIPVEAQGKGIAFSVEAPFSHNPPLSLASSQFVLIAETEVTSGHEGSFMPQ